MSTVIEQVCTVILENTETKMLDKVTVLLQNQALALLFLIGMPLLFFTITSLIINPGKGKIKFGKVVWAYLISTVLSTLIGIAGYLTVITL